jgi:uncharacterized protein (DUF1015 family)
MVSPRVGRPRDPAVYRIGAAARSPGTAAGSPTGGNACPLGARYNGGFVSGAAFPMTLIRPFRGLRPRPDTAADVAAPPYDVLSSDEARQRAAGHPRSFLHVSKAEIDLPPDTDPYDPAVYRTAADNLRRLVDDGVLQRDPTPCYYAYRLSTGSTVKTGLVVAASVNAYVEQRIRRHEFTRPDKETDRVRQIEALSAQTGPVMLAYPGAAEVDDLLARAASGAPDSDVMLDGVRHQVWPVAMPDTVDRLTRLFDAMPALYIADGHHRSAAAARVAESRREHGTDAWQGFLAVAFPHHAMRIMDYNRVVADLAGMDAEGFLSRLRERLAVTPVDTPVRPRRRGEFGVYLPGRWYRVVVPAETIPTDDPIARLDVSLLSDLVLAPILGIHDLRRDKRIDFVGGIRGLPELERRVAGGMAAAFALHPTSMEDLMAVADRGDVMPPKSTWFEPKLADGLVSYLLDEH